MGYMDIMKNRVELGVVKTMLNSTEARELARIKSSETSSSVHPKNHKKILMDLEPSRMWYALLKRTELRVPERRVG